MLNRQALFELIERLASPRTGEGGLLMVRTRNLRDYEAMFGYEACDFLVEAFEARLQDCLRGVDASVRVGECDYAVMLPGLRDRNHVALAAAKVARSLLEPLQVRGRPAWVNVAVGGCMVADATTPTTLCRQADLACGQAWGLRERHALHDGAPSPVVGYDDLHEAIEGNRMQVFLQPIFSLQTGEVKSFESLSRWSHPEMGAISPAVFIPMAEQAGLIHELTRWNINATLRHCAPWLRDRPGMHCAINVSPIALAAPGFTEQLAAAIRIWNMHPSSVVLEVTETAFVDNHELLAGALTELHQLGMGISIDDFGTGYSSLSYLRSFPVDEIKIDMSFVREIIDNERVATLVSSVIEMAHGLDAVTVAEGIEGTDIWNRLQSMGCDQGQGYYPGRPQPAEEALAAHASAS